MEVPNIQPGMQFDYHGTSPIVVSITFATIGSFVVAVRLVTRWRIVNNLGADDWVILASAVSSKSSRGRKNLD
jgi:hypothetical protein